MRTARLALALALCSPPATPAQGAEFFPRGLGFLPPVAAPCEARVGLAQEFGSTRMRVAIGNAFDLFEDSAGDESQEDGLVLRGGADFFAYGLAQTLQGYRLKIGAVDGFFGLHLSASWGGPLSLRFRALHHSAHLVDGLWDETTGTWLGPGNPIPYSRNFGELVAAWRVGPGPVSARFYGGVLYAPIVKPVEIQEFAALAGAECHAGGGPVVYAAWHFDLSGAPAYCGSNTLEAGVKFGEWEGGGIRLFAGYANGLETFGQFYNQRREFWSAGLAFDYW